MDSPQTAWQKTLKILPWIVIVIGIAAILKGLTGQTASGANLASIIAGIITLGNGTVCLYYRNR